MHKNYIIFGYSQTYEAFKKNTDKLIDIYEFVTVFTAE